MSISSKRVRLETGLQAHYMEQGDKEGVPVILLHGYTDSWFSFSLAMPHISSRLRLLALDQRGHGDSDRPDTGYTLGEFARDVLAFMDAVGLTTAAIVGHSMGSFVAQHVAAMAPDRVERLVLIGSGTTIQTPGVIDLLQEIAGFQDTMDEEFVRRFQTSTVHRPVRADFMERVVADSRRLSASAWHAILEGLATSPRPDFSKIAVPALVVWGDQDYFFVRSEQEGLVALLPTATLKVYPQCGHSPHWEHPQRFAADVEAFLAGGKAAQSTK